MNLSTDEQATKCLLGLQLPTDIMFSFPSSFSLGRCCSLTHSCSYLHGPQAERWLHWNSSFHTCDSTSIISLGGFSRLHRCGDRDWPAWWTTKIRPESRGHWNMLTLVTQIIRLLKGSILFHCVQKLHAYSKLVLWAPSTDHGGRMSGTLGGSPFSFLDYEVM